MKRVLRTTFTGSAWSFWCPALFLGARHKVDAARPRFYGISIGHWFVGVVRQGTLEKGDTVSFQSTYEVNPR